MKKLISHFIAFIFGVVLSVNLKSPRTQIVVEARDKVVEKIVEKRVVEFLPQVKTVYRDRVITQIVPGPVETVYLIKLVKVETFMGEKNRVFVSSGYGINGFNVDQGASFVEVSEKKGFVFGFGYQRKLNDYLSVGAQMLYNNTYLANVGMDF